MHATGSGSLGLLVMTPRSTIRAAILLLSLGAFGAFALGACTTATDSIEDGAESTDDALKGEPGSIQGTPLRPCTCNVTFGNASKVIYTTFSGSHLPSYGACMTNVCLPLLTGSSTGTVSTNTGLDNAVRGLPNSADSIGSLPASGYPSKAQYLKVTARVGTTGTPSYANIRGPLPQRQCPPGTWLDTASGRCDEAMGTTGHPECFNAVTGTVVNGLTNGVNAGGPETPGFYPAELITANGNQILRVRKRNCLSPNSSVPSCPAGEYVLQNCFGTIEPGKCAVNLTNCDMAGHTNNWLSLGNEFYTSDNRQIYHHHSVSSWGW